MRTASCLLWLAAWAGTGCVSNVNEIFKTKPLADTRPAALAPAAPAPAALPRPVVTADQVDDHNAREMAGALLDELNTDAQEDASPAPSKADAKAEDGKHP